MKKSQKSGNLQQVIHLKKLSMTKQEIIQKRKELKEDMEALRLQDEILIELLSKEIEIETLKKIQSKLN